MPNSIEDERFEAVLVVTAGNDEHRFMSSFMNGETSTPKGFLKAADRNFLLLQAFQLSEKF